MNLLFYLLDVVIEFLEGVGCGSLVLLNVGLKRFEAVGEILNVGPSPVSFGSLDLLSDRWVLCKVTIVQVAVVPEEEGGEV
jgi:hypothetical protein